MFYPSCTWNISTDNIPPLRPVLLESFQLTPGLIHLCHTRHFYLVSINLTWVTHFVSQVYVSWSPLVSYGWVAGQAHILPFYDLLEATLGYPFGSGRSTYPGQHTADPHDPVCFYSVWLLERHINMVPRKRLLGSRAIVWLLEHYTNMAPLKGSMRVALVLGHVRLPVDQQVMGFISYCGEMESASKTIQPKMGTMRKRSQVPRENLL